MIGALGAPPLFLRALGLYLRLDDFFIRCTAPKLKDPAVLSISFASGGPIFSREKMGEKRA